MKKNPLSDRWLAPLLYELEQLDFLLTHSARLSIFTAQSGYKEVRRERLPEHMHITPRQLKGPRQPVRGSWHARPARLLQARWPRDRMLETASPCLCIVAQGEANLHLGDYILRCRPGDLVFIPAGVPRGDHIPNTVSDDPYSSCKILYLYPGRLYGRGLECWISHSQGNQLLPEEQRGAALIKSHFLAALFEGFGEEVQRTSNPALLLSLFRSLLLFMKQEIEEGRALIPPLRRSEQQAGDEQSPIKYTLSYIESHLSEPLTIEVLARKAAVSPTLFKQMFRQEVGVTFHQYLTQKRIEFASDLLENTDIKIENIAHNVGLKYTRFRQLFYERVGCSPSQYRKRTSK